MSPKRSKVYEAKVPAVPIRPTRPPMSKRVKLAATAALLVVLVAVIAAGGFLAHSSSAPKGRLVTIPAADRKAPRALVRAAEAVRFHPSTAAGAGRVEDEPAAAASPPSTDSLLPVGSIAPDFDLRTPAGDRVRLRDLRGKTVLLEFFTTWCPHCAAEAPHLQRLFASFPKQKFAFAAVDAESEDAPSVFAYHVYFGLGFPALLDPGSHAVTFPEHGHAGPVTSRYRVNAYPTFYVIGPRGRITWRSDGEQPDALLSHELMRAAG
jgi:peroxiredoxin